MNGALRVVFGDEVSQRGSNITSERLRFDFSFGRKVTKEELKQVEAIVNEAIGEKIDVILEEMSPEKAYEEGTIGVFSGKYGEIVKVYTIPGYSKEICGGPHAKNTGEHIAYLVYDGEKFIGAGGVSFYQVMPTYHNPSGKKAYIMNMYTAPEYRRQGIAYRTLDLLVKAARDKGISQIALEATDMGRPLYGKYGFVKMEDEMML